MNRSPARPLRVSFACFLVATGAVACGSASSVLVPHARTTAAPASATPSPSPHPSATATPAPTATSSAAAIVARVTTAQNDAAGFFAKLPHVNAVSDVNALLAHMSQSPLYSAVELSDGGISAMLADGTGVFVSTDHLAEEYATSHAGTTTSARTRRFVSRAPRRFDGPTAASPTAAFLVNMREEGYAADGSPEYEFSPARQAQFAQSFQEVGIPAVEADASLEDIVALGAQSPGLDFLAIDTHGGAQKYVDGTKLTTPRYIMIADDIITVQGVEDTWRDDIDLGNVGYDIDIYQEAVNNTDPDNSIPAAHFYFTTGFLTSHLRFNQGAIVDNGSCLGADLAGTSEDVGGILTKAGVGRYFGWTGIAGFNDADQTDAFIVDRLTGEVNTNLAQYVTQRDPLQRPFPLDDIEAAIPKEQRSGPISTPGLTYAESISGSQWLPEDFGGESVENPPIEYGLPSISYVAVTEDPNDPTLTVYGQFPSQEGTVEVIDPSQTEGTPIAPVTWSTDHIVVPIPVTGIGSKGDVMVTSAAGVDSNVVPLTQWTGTLTGTENATWSAMGSGTGSGSGSIVSTFNVDFRADVHPTVMTIDATPVPQNLTFTNVEGDSTGQVSAIDGSFATSDGMHSATLGLSPNLPPLAPGTPPLSNTFYVRAVPGQPASCNNAVPGPQAGPTNVFCPALGYAAISAGTCTDDSGVLCSTPNWEARGTIGATTAASDGMLIFTMNPATYAITVTSTSPSVTINLFEALAHVTGSVTGTINPPVAPPAAARRRHARALRSRHEHASMALSSHVSPRGGSVHARRVLA